MGIELFILAAFHQSFPAKIIGVLLLLFFAILFLQSGIDKVLDRKGNLDWLKGHFGKSMFKGVVPLLLTILSIMELLSGASSLVGAIFFGFSPLIEQWYLFGISALCGITLLCLFLGQRVAKDYGGAAGIVPYFIVSLISMGYFLLFIQLPD